MIKRKRRKGYVVVATKIRKDVADRLERLCHAQGINKYQMLQMVCDSLVRYMDDRHNLSPDLERVMSVFDKMTEWKEAYNLADPTVDDSVSAVYFFGDDRGQRHGQRPRLVTKPYFGLPQQTTNTAVIFDYIIRTMFPGTYRRLHARAKEMECHSLAEWLHVVADDPSTEYINAECRRTFEDADRADNGRPVRYGQRTRRKKSYTPDTMPLQFDDYDQEDDDGAQ